MRHMNIKLHENDTIFGEEIKNIRKDINTIYLE